MFQGAEARMQKERNFKLGKPGGEVRVYNEGAIRHNAAVVEYCRTCAAVFSGMGAGILGLTGLYGFGFYFLSVIGLWLILIAKAGTNYQSYFPSRRALLTNGFFGAVFTYILCWTFAYGMVHVY